jgi:hypothetical protein
VRGYSGVEMVGDRAEGALFTAAAVVQVVLGLP